VRDNVFNVLEENLSKISPNVFDRLFNSRDRDTALLLDSLITKNKWHQIKNINEASLQRICREIVRDGEARLRK